MHLSRITIAGAIAAGIVVTTAGSASAHHCYKNEWADAAYHHHRAGGTAWIPLSQMGRQFLIPEELQDVCGWAADKAVEDFMKERNLTQEPLIHGKAVTGSGAYAKGKAPQPYSYLTDADFDLLGGALFGYLAECQEGLE